MRAREAYISVGGCYRETVVVVVGVDVVVVVAAVITLTRCRDNQVRGNRTGSGNSGAEEYLKRTKTKKPKQVIHASFYG